MNHICFKQDKDLKALAVNPFSVPQGVIIIIIRLKFFRSNQILTATNE